MSVIVVRCTMLLMTLLLCAFVLLDLRWPPQPTQRIIAMRLITMGMTPAMVARIHDAAAMWTSPGVRFALTTQTSPEAHPAGTITAGSVVPIGSARTDHYGGPGGIVACSIMIDIERGGPWHDGPDVPPEGFYDFQTAAAHEFGHCLGLNHTTVETGQPVMGAKIHAGAEGGWKRVLAPDDRAGRDTLFPVRPVVPVPPERRRSGCALFGG